MSNYISYSTNQKLRYEAASGGIATNILIYLYKNNLIDGAIVTKMDEKNKTQSKTYVANNIKEIKKSKTSKYCPTHPLSELENIDKNKKYAFVGLPCHIHGLRKLQEKEKWLKNSIICTLGLFCTHSVNYKGTDLILNKLAYGKKHIKSFKYRGNGWPGSANINYDNENLKISLDDYWNPYFAPYFFTPYRCLSCSDLFAELADVSLGDAWLKNIMDKDNQGSSIIISRTKFVEEILKEMKNNNHLDLFNISKKEVKESQRLIMIRKKIR